MSDKIKEVVKNKRTIREMQRQDPISPMRFPKGTKPAGKADKFKEEMKRKGKI